MQQWHISSWKTGLQAQVFYHLNGSFHSKNHEGIVAFLKQSNPDLKIVTIHMAEQENIEALEEDNMDLADFIIAVPADMIKTY